MRDKDTRDIREYVPLIVTETQGNHGTRYDRDIEEQPALLEHQ